MNNQRLEIKKALEAMVEDQRHREFQHVAIHLAKRSWPELQATEEQKDGGEDATSFTVGADGLRRSVAASLTGSLGKIKDDAGRINGRGVEIDFLVFITPVPINNLTATEWADVIKKEFGHGLQIISQAEIIALLEQPENRWLCKPYLGLDLEADKPIPELVVVLRKAATQILDGWKAANHFEDTKAVELTLFKIPASRQRTPNGEVNQLTVRDLSELVLERRSATLFGEPGAGKTYTLIQLADALLRDSSAPIPILVPLPEWANSEKGILAFIESQLAVEKLTSAEIAKLCANGHVVLLLNGWNEISDAMLERTSSELKALVLPNPALPVIISTRNSQIQPPLSTENNLFVASLSHGQKLTIVKKSGLSDPAEFVTELETNEALAGVTDSPLFLNAAISIAHSGQKLPNTRYGILSQFVEHSEASADHALALKGPPCNAFHRRYLECLAVKMVNLGGAALTFDDAISEIANCNKLLESEGHLKSASSSAEVLDCLVRHHVLVLSPAPGKSYRFVHQQFQEWFAAESLKRSVGEIANTQSADKRFAFQQTVLNRIQWEEPLHFLMERLGAGSDVENTLAATVVKWAMPVDLLLAADLAGAAGESVWPHVGDALGTALRSWYNKGEPHRHCALAAMLASGAPDFQDILWPLIESSDQNVRLFTYRAWRPFSLSCLGSEWRTRFSKWSAERKAEFIREFSWGPSREHLVLASDLIKAQESPGVKLACFELLLDAQAYETLISLVANVDANDWPAGFLERIVSRLPNRYLNPFLAKAKNALPEIKQFSARRAVLLSLQRVNNPDWLDLFKREIEAMALNSELDFRPPHDYLTPNQPTKQNASPYLSEYFEAIGQRDPQWAAAWLAKLLVQGSFWWKPFTDYIGKLPQSELQLVTAAAVDARLDVNATRNRAMALATVASLDAARTLIKAFLEASKADDKPTKQPGFDRSHALDAGIKELPVNTFVDAVLAEANDAKDFLRNQELLKLLSQAAISQVSDGRKDALRSFILSLDKDRPMTCEDNGWFQTQLVDVLGRVGKPDDAKTLETWLIEDVRRLNEHTKRQQENRQEWETNGRKGKCPAWVLSGVAWNNYQRAFAQLGGEPAAAALLRLLDKPGFLNFAAIGLCLLTSERNQKSPSFGDRPDYLGIQMRREEAKGDNTLNSTRKNYADAIFTVIERYFPEMKKEGSKFPRNEILGAASALAALSDLRALPLLQEFASDKYQQWTVVNALHNLMLSGTVLPAEVVAQLVEPFISENEKPQWSSGNDGWYLVARAIAVLLFSDNPKLGIERIRKLPEFRLKNYYFRDLLVPLGCCLDPGAIDLLLELAAMPDNNNHRLYEVATILAQSPNSSAKKALITLLDQLCRGELNSRSDLPRVIASTSKNGGPIWEEVKRRCKAPQSPLERSVLLQILGEIESYEAALCLCELMNDEFPIAYPAEHLVEEAATVHVPSGGSAYYLKPRDATELKKRLINIASSDVKRRTSALQLLCVIRKRRLEHGWPANEAIHPEIELLIKLDAPWELI